MKTFASCCLLSYERPDFLQTAIASLVRHAEFPLELIVHDDGSESVHVKKLLRQFVDKGLISTLIENPPGHNQGVGVAINRTFDVAQGDYLLKLDQDLIFEPGWLRKAVAILEANRRTHLERGAEPRIGALGLFRYGAEPVRYEDMFIRDYGDGETGWEDHHDFVGSAFVVAREIWEQHKPMPQHSAAFAEDLEFKKKLKYHDLKMALPKTGDLAKNQGFGYGPSTVVVKDEKGALTSRDIHYGPKLIETGGLH